MWYLMGGDSDDNDIVYSISLPDLISHTLSSSSGSTHHDMWKKISGLRLHYSTPLCMGGALLAVGRPILDLVTFFIKILILRKKLDVDSE